MREADGPWLAVGDCDMEIKISRRMAGLPGDAHVVPIQAAGMHHPHLALMTQCLSHA